MKRVCGVPLCVLLLLSATAFAEEKFFNSSGLKIHYIERGLPSGEPVVLIHGLGGSVATWSEFGVIDRLAERYRVIALDVRGHGLSDKPHEPRQYGSGMGLDVIGVLEHLRIPKAHVVGYSMGGSIITKLLTTHPDRFLTATVGGAAGMFTWTQEDQRVSDEEAADREREGVSRSLMRRLSPPNAPEPSEDEWNRRKEAFYKNPNNDARALAAVARGRGTNIVSPTDAAKVTVPTLAVVGGDDPNLAQFYRWKAVRPSVTLIVLDGATHSGPQGVRSRPEYTDAILKFLAQHPAR